MAKKDLTIQVNSREDFDKIAAELSANPRTTKMWDQAKLTVEKAFYTLRPGEGSFTTEVCNAIAISTNSIRKGEEHFIYATQLQKQVPINDLSVHLKNL